ncbi:MAG: biotin--[acetyl-CoA-carboxylase] ligase [Zoogloeaceae bacterium]|jgi:BirA family biotin operon repressor/biotin-[acetyl-CoA-carboxylase] ligase|nr:biotin--[acetyl-CoA-carboxylase] ligase [Zoogloeaceae bacterium]
MQRLRQALGAYASRFDVDILPECPSTNALLLERAAQGAPSGSVLVAERQTAGRGRRGRVWISRPEDSLTFSLLWRWRKDARLAGLSLAVGLALHRALHGLGARDLGLKWPNDLLYCGAGGAAKLAGILIELASDTRGVASVIGVGINLFAPQVPEQATAGLVDCCAETPSRDILLAALLTELARHLDLFAHAGFAALRADWQLRHVWQDKNVRLHEDSRIVEGICRGVDDDGALLLATADGLERFWAGDVSLRAGAA